MIKYIIVFLMVCSNSLIIAQYNLETCTTDIASDVPEFFHKYFHCITARMSTSGNYVNLYFNGLPPYETWYYDGGQNDIPYSAPGSPECPQGPPSGDCYFQVPNNLAEVDYVISIPVNPSPIDGLPKGQNSIDGVFNSADANEYPLGTIGAALNGGNMYNPVAAGEDLIEDEMYGFDLYSGHPDFEGAYHYHSTTAGPLEVLNYKIPDHVTNTTPGNAEIELYGITCDGTVVMGCTELDKSEPDFSALDCQHGHVHDLIDESGNTLLTNRYHTHICYTSFTDNDNTGNGCQDHEFNPESAYYLSSNTDPNKNACEASSTPYESDAPDITGCTDSDACNYDTNANVDDSSCTYAQENYDCAGNCTANIDCAGVCDGSGVMDDCNVCDGGNVDKDCAGACFGSAVEDNCYVCDADASNDCVQDCAGTWSGLLVVDECGVCGGDGSQCAGIMISGLIPKEYSIHNIYPNPFNPVTNIIYGIPENTTVQITVFNLSGKQVELLVNEFQTMGYHSVDWYAENHPSGVYFIKMATDKYARTQKLMLLK